MPNLGGGDDRIGALPDEVLQHVLSFLPAREAVQTCLLARRWRQLWKFMPSLRITCLNDWRKLTRQDVKNLNRSVKNLLLLHDRSEPLDLCDFNINPFDYCRGVPQISLWTQQALLCKARMLRVELAVDNDTSMLDNLPLISQHLTMLELRCVALECNFLDFGAAQH